MMREGGVFIVIELGAVVGVIHAREVAHVIVAVVQDLAVAPVEDAQEALVGDVITSYSIHYTKLYDQHGFRLGAEYFYPASSVKLFAAVAALERLHELAEETGKPVGPDADGGDVLLRADDVLQRGDELVGDVITSYSIHYTKLYDVEGARVSDDDRRGLHSYHRLANVLFIVGDVITSYSIHYTKLYDAGQQPLFDMLWGESVTLESLA